MKQAQNCHLGKKKKKTITIKVISAFTVHIGFYPSLWDDVGLYVGLDREYEGDGGEYEVDVGLYVGLIDWQVTFLHYLVSRPAIVCMWLTEDYNFGM